MRNNTQLIDSFLIVTNVVRVISFLFFVLVPILILKDQMKQGEEQISFSFLVKNFLLVAKVVWVISFPHSVIVDVLIDILNL